MGFVIRYMSGMGDKRLNQRRIFYGWWVVAAGMGITALSSTLYSYGFSAFFIPWRTAFGWPRALLGGVVGLSRLEGGLVAPVAGWSIDKYGPRRIMFLGLSMMGIGFIALSQVSSLLMLYVVFIGLLATGSSLGTHRPVQVAAANWFVRRRGRVMGLLASGTGIGGSFVFLFALLIERFGWQAGAIFAGIAIWVLGMPLAWVIRHKPEQMGLLPDGDRSPEGTEATTVAGATGSIPLESQSQASPEATSKDEASMTSKAMNPRRFWMSDPRSEIDLTVWQAVRTSAFWLMALTYAIWAAVPSINTVYLAPFLAEELGIDYVAALGGLSFFIFVSMIGRVGFGFLADYVNIRLLVGALLVVEGVGIFLFSQVQTLAQVPFYVIIFAISHGGIIPLRPVLQGYLFGRKHFGTIGGFLSFVDLPATVAGPIWIGWLADNISDGYRVGFQIIAATLVLGAVSILLARRPSAPLPVDRPPRMFQAFRQQ